MNSFGKITLSFCIGTCSLLFAFAHESNAQTETPEELQVPASAKKGLFDSEDILQITLRGDMAKLLKDKSDNPKDYPLVLSYTDLDSTEIAMPVEVRTRGNFRRLFGNCANLPLMIEFPKNGEQMNTVFWEQKKLKLVMPCRGEKYIVREWLAYKLYNLLTPKSFRARLVKVKLDDGKNKKNNPPFYGILLEEEKQMARRNDLVSVERKLKPYQVQPEPFLTMAVFEYMIGNTDWSIQYLQNIKLLAEDSISAPYAVPYDFDHAGIVGAPYARPAEELRMKSVRQRRYRGHCVMDLQKFEIVIARYNQLKEDIYRIYTDCALLDAKYIESTVRFLDEFYTTINDPKSWQKDFAYPCDPKGTGNVVIQGLKGN